MNGNSTVEVEVSGFKSFVVPADYAGYFEFYFEIPVGIDCKLYVEAQGEGGNHGIFYTVRT